MKKELLKKFTWVTALVLAAALSIFALAPVMTRPETYQGSLAALQEKQTTVLELTAASTAASAAITLLPGDIATPVAEKLADLSGYFLIVLCAIFLEKYLLTITASAAFHVLFPLACLLGVAYVCSQKRFFRVLAWRLACFALALVLVIPSGIYASSMIERTYQASISETLEDAKKNVAEVESDATTEVNTDQQSGLSGLFSKVKDSIGSAASATLEKFKQTLNDLIEALAILLVTSCLIPILVILLFLWLFKLIIGIDIPLPALKAEKRNTEQTHQEQ